jgi:ABC-2 type transport system permease protein
MSLIARIARQELRTAWRTRTTTALAVILTLLTLTAAVAGHARFGEDARQRARYQHMVGEQFSAQPNRHPHRVSHYGFLVFRPRAPLGFFDSGVESHAGTSIFLEAHRQNTANFAAAIESGAGGRFGDLTPAIVLQLLVPLFIFAVAGVSVTREREAGTFTMLLCQGASWRQILAGKLLGSLMVVMVVLLPGWTLTVAWLATRADVAWSSDLLGRAALLLVGHAVFLSGCAGVAISVSARSRSSRAALMTVLSLWIALWIVVPRLAPAAAASLYPTPSRAQFDAEVERRVRQLGDSHNPNDRQFAALKAKVLTEHNVATVDALPFNYSGFVMQEAERLTTEAYQEHIATLVETHRRQARLVGLAGAVSPYLALRVVSMALSGSDPSHIIDFDRQAEAYRYRLIQALNKLHMHEVAAANDRYTSAIEGAPSRLRIDRAFFEDLPAFDYRAPALRWALGANPIAIASFALVTAGIAVWFVLTSRRPIYHL